ncbi:flagellar hook-basal body protein [Desulfosporosinus meridiei]|uniref:Flagellar hook-basal body protein n=1 Tax=Desulfosporosinus meridiei (strain ATCC BAA-275 / DSM 13257 / KCTC 12902 / NCIMB 13706 / S10) TaxID=768704 RepID=J7J013_DESMD|nr:flagellar hook-basal body protein [Desulfosporosinus meridiei]AFQ45724.1 flagellar hook-basal body protein [Desulfosporosinus meridiei DSM 13257]
MIRGLYTSATGMIAAQTQSEVIGDNVVNIKTAGFKEQLASNISFPSKQIYRIGGDNTSVALGGMGTGLGVDQVTRSNVQGSLDVTDAKTDLALKTLGYFVVQTPDGDRYTRNGHFQLDSEGMLRTAEGFTVQGEEGPIGPLSLDFSVSSEGVIFDQGQEVNHLRIVEIPEDALQREGQSLYNATEGVQAAVGAQVQQGAIERSNVNLSGQLVNMMSVMKAYEANQKVIQTQDELLGKAVNEVGKI